MKTPPWICKERRAGGELCRGRVQYKPAEEGELTLYQRSFDSCNQPSRTFRTLHWPPELFIVSTIAPVSHTHKYQVTIQNLTGSELGRCWVIQREDR